MARFSLTSCLKTEQSDCKEYFSKSLFLVGEIGGNDYNYAFFKGKTLDDAKSYVPTVASAVIDATEVSTPAMFFSLSRALYCSFRDGTVSSFHVDLVA
jgi:hypothetical protein